MQLNELRVSEEKIVKSTFGTQFVCPPRDFDYRYVVLHIHHVYAL